MEKWIWVPGGRPTADGRFGWWLFADFVLRFDYLLIWFSSGGLHESWSTSLGFSIGVSWVPIQGSGREISMLEVGPRVTFFPLQHLAKFSTFSTFDLQTFFLAFVLLFTPCNHFKHTSMVARLSIPYPVGPTSARIPMRLHFELFHSFFTLFSL